MSSLLDIAQGWWEFIKGSPATKLMAAKRLAICDTCDHKQQLNPTAKTLIKGINAKGNLFVCGICHCPLASKTSAPGSFCPIDASGRDIRDASGRAPLPGTRPKWDRAGAESYY